MSQLQRHLRPSTLTALLYGGAASRSADCPCVAAHDSSLFCCIVTLSCGTTSGVNYPKVYADGTDEVANQFNCTQVRAPRLWGRVYMCSSALPLNTSSRACVQLCPAKPLPAGMPPSLCSPASGTKVGGACL